MAENVPRRNKSLATAFAATDRIESQLPALLAMGRALRDLAAGRCAVPNEIEAELASDCVEAVAFWLGVLQNALCDLETGGGKGGDA